MKTNQMKSMVTGIRYGIGSKELSAARHSGASECLCENSLAVRRTSLGTIADDDQRSNREATKRIHILGQSADGIANGPAWAALTKHRLRKTRTHAEPAFAQGPEQGTAECDEPKQQPRPNVRLLGTWICTDRSACRSEQMTATSHPAEPLSKGFGR